MNYLIVQLSSAAAAGSMLLVLWAYLPLAWRLHDPLGRVLAAAATVLALAYLLRSAAWDWVHLPSGPTVNAVFNLLIVLAAYLFLRGRLLTIPEPERSHWRWWTAWAHPASRCLIPWRRK